MSTRCYSHLVGSISSPDAATTFREVAGELGDGVRRMPDGEVGERFYWIQFQTFRFDEATGLERVGEPGYVIRDLFDARPFRLTGEPIMLPPLGYADAAIESYASFAGLKAEGVIPADVRFQVSLPTPVGVVAAFVIEPDRAAFEPVYRDALFAEVARIQHEIPHDELAIQWDTATEFALLEQISLFGSPLRAWWGADYAALLEGTVSRLVEAGAQVADDVELGYHLCYGDVEEEHFVQPKDAGILADVARGILANATRPVSWIHLPVPIGRDDEAYFAPLASVPWGATEVYLGLVHHEDGVDGALRRAAAARTAVAEFGIATECGFGRGPRERTVALLDLHRDVAAALSRV